MITLRDHDFTFISQRNSALRHVTQQEYECISQGLTMSQVGLSRALRFRSRVQFEASPICDLWPTNVTLGQVIFLVLSFFPVSIKQLLIRIQLPVADAM